MEKLTLNKFEDSKLENLLMLKGGVTSTTLDGVEDGDRIDDNCNFWVRDGYGGWTPGNPDFIDCPE